MQYDFSVAISRIFFKLFNWVFIIHFLLINIVWLVMIIPTLSVNHPYGNVQFSYLPAPWESKDFLPYLLLNISIILISVIISHFIKVIHKRYIAYFLLVCLTLFSIFVISTNMYMSQYAEDFGILSGTSILGSLFFIFLVRTPSFSVPLGIAILSGTFLLASLVGEGGIGVMYFTVVFLVPYYIFAFFVAMYLNRKLVVNQTSVN